MNVLLAAAMPDQRELIHDDEGHAQILEDPALRAAWGENALARTVGLAIGAYRQRHGLTQAELGARIGMSQSQVARLERMDHTPSFESLLRLTEALGIEIAIAIGPKAEPPSTTRTATKREIRDVSEQTVISVREAR